MNGGDLALFVKLPYGSATPVSMRGRRSLGRGGEVKLKAGDEFMQELLIKFFGLLRRMEAADDVELICERAVVVHVLERSYCVLSTLAAGRDVRV